MHEDQVNEELAKFEEDAKKEGRLKIPIKFPLPKESPELNIGDMDFGEPQYVEENTEKAAIINRKGKKISNG